MDQELTIPRGLINKYHPPPSPPRGVRTDESAMSSQPPEVTRQTEGQRAVLLSNYTADRLYQLKRNCNATQDQDISLLEGELVALVEDRDPFGSSSRWLVEAGGEYNMARCHYRAAPVPQILGKVGAEGWWCAYPTSDYVHTLPNCHGFG